MLWRRKVESRKLQSPRNNWKKIHMTFSQHSSLPLWFLRDFTSNLDFCFIIFFLWSFTLQECCICLSPYEHGAELHALPCNHLFHATCIVKWLKMNATCPLCKFNILKGNEQIWENRWRQGIQLGWKDGARTFNGCMLIHLSMSNISSPELFEEYGKMEQELSSLLFML